MSISDLGWDTQTAVVESDLHFDREKDSWILSVQLDGTIKSVLSSDQAFQQLNNQYEGLLMMFPTIRQQWDCHVLGSLPEFDVYDLEFSRTDNPGWATTAAERIFRAGRAASPAWACNW